jgi:hypothetical protein
MEHTMKKFVLILGAVALSLIGGTAIAQKSGPGEDQAVKSKPATAEEKKAAREKRIATGKEMGKKDEGRLEDGPNTQQASKKATDAEKAAAKAKRQETGKSVAKEGSAGGEAKNQKP